MTTRPPSEPELAPTLAPETAETLDIDESDATLDAPALPATSPNLADVGLSGRWTATPEPQGRYDDTGREMGRGGIGRVYLAFDNHLRRNVAVKELLASSPESGSSSLRDRSPKEQRFVREAWVTGQLQHPNIVPIYELGQRLDGTLYYTMKVVRGHTLADALHRASNLEERLKLLDHVLDLCQAIGYAHARGVIHRDLKPGNVMLGEFGETVVLDWGLAKVRGHEDIRGQELADVMEALKAGELAQTVEGTPIGTPAYMSPEQATGELEHIDERSDVWGLGVILYELVTGHLPFDGENAFALIMQVLKDPIPPVLERAPQVPPDLAAIIHKALARSPDARYPNAGELAHDLKAFIDGRQVGVYAYSSLELFQRFVARNKALTATVCAAFLLAVAGIIAVALAYQEADHERTIAEQERTNAVNAQAEEQAARQLAETRRLDSLRTLAPAYAERAKQLLAERKLLHAHVFATAALLHSGAHPQGPYARANTQSPEAAAERAELASLYDQTRSDWKLAARWPGVHDKLTALAFHPSGALLARADSRGHVELWDMETHQAHTSPPPTGSDITSLAFSPDGKRLAYAGITDKTVYLWDLEKERLSTLPLERDRAFGHITALHFGLEESLFVVGVAEIGRIDLRQGQELNPPVPIPGGARTASASLSPDKTSLLVTDAARGIHHFSTQPLLHVHTFQHPEHPAVAAWVDNTHIATVGNGPTLHIWKPDGTLAQSLDATGHAMSLDVAQEGRILATGGAEARLWTPEGERLEEVFADTPSELIALSPQGNSLAMGSLTQANGAVWVYTRASQRDTLEIQSHVAKLAMDREGKQLAILHTDRTQNLSILDTTTDTGVIPSPHIADNERVVEVSFPKQGPPMALLVRDGELFQRALGEDAEETSLGAFVAVEQLQLSAASCDAEAKRCVLINNDIEAEVVELDSGERFPITLPMGFPIVVALHPGGERLALADLSGRVAVYDLTQRQRVWMHFAHRESVLALAFDSEGRLASSAYDGTIAIHDGDSGEVLQRRSMGDEPVYRLSFAPDGRLLSLDTQSGVLWEEGRKVQTFTLRGAEHDALFHPVTQNVLLADNGTLTTHPRLDAIWEHNPQDLLARAEAQSGTQLKGFVLESDAPPEEVQAPQPPSNHAESLDIRILWRDRTSREAPLEGLSVQRIGTPEPNYESNAEGVARVKRVDGESVLELVTEHEGRPRYYQGPVGAELEWITLEAALVNLVPMSVGLPAEPDKVFVWGRVLRSELHRLETVPCAAIAISPEATVVHNTPGATHTGTNGRFFIIGLKPDVAHTLTAKVGEESATLEIPPLPAKTIATVDFYVPPKILPTAPTCE